MDRIAVCVVLSMCMFLFQGCGNSKEEKYAEFFENGEAVDFSDLMELYIHNQSDSLCQHNFDEDEYDYLLCDTAFAIQLPHLTESMQPFLSGAEVFYNSCLLAFNVWSDHELWIRGKEGFELVSEDKIKEAVSNISENCIRDRTIREAATVYKQSLINIMSSSDENESGMDYLMTYSEAIEAKAYQFFSDEEAFLDSLDNLRRNVLMAARPCFEGYLQASDDERLDFMLNSLNDCKTFDEQCSLVLNWADSRENI